MDQAGRYYGTLFRGNNGVTQGDLLYPTIFNMVLDEVIFHWIKLVMGEEAG